MNRFVSTLAAVTVGVTALSVYASPLTEGVARADEEPAAAIVPVTPPAQAVQTVQAAPAPKPVQAAAPVARPAPVVATPPAIAAAPPPAPVPVPEPAPAAVQPTPAAQAISAAASAPAAPAATPLNLVPSKPLELAEPAPTSNLGWKLGAMGLLAAAGFWAYTKKKGATPAKLESIPEMRILRRTSVGVRSELLLVDLEGQRILLGVTPSNIQSLLIVPDSAMTDPIPVEEPQDSVAAIRSMPSMAQLMKQLDDDETRGERLDRSERTPRNDRSEQPRESVRTPTERASAERTRSTSAKRVPAKKRRPEDEIEEDTAAPVEGQAEGLLAFRRGRGQ